MARLISRILVLVAAGFSTGCSGSRYPTGERVSVYPVSGRVVVAGKPAESARVYFTPTTGNPEEVTTYESVTNEEGKFVVGTYSAEDGLPEGQYAVRIVWPERFGGSNRDNEVDVFRGRFNQASKPAFVVTVKTEPNELPAFTLR